MRLKQFIEKFVESNTIIRLVYKEKSGHRIIHESWNDVSMEHEILNKKGINRHYINNNVLGIASIMTFGNWPEAINIVVERLENQPFIEDNKCCLGAV